MEVRKPVIKSIPYSEFKDNESLEKIVDELHYFILLITVLITAVFLVVAAFVIAKLMGPRTYNKVKGEPFECGIPTHGSSWLPVHVGYYLFAILFLVFDVETVFLYPWAVVVKEFGVMAMVSIGFFLLVLVFGLAYAWRKGALEWK
ncbi:nADH-quinone oxidoreductase subunit A [Prevotella sp. CAG:1124]|nr:nADH-quinone oxidoreductase subunit A [Prevotella sp. CAG:1124]